MINGFSNFENEIIKQQINNFVSNNDVPKKPNILFNDDSYVYNLTIYEIQSQSYFISFCKCINQYLIEKSDNFNGKIKDAYYKLRKDYDEYRDYLSKAKHDYNESKQIEKSFKKDGSMSPSNPFYSIYNEENSVFQISIEPMEGDTFLVENSDDSLFIKEFKKLKKLIRDIKKKHKPKLSKNQRKKLKKNTKIEYQEHNFNKVELEINSEICITDDPQVIIQEFFKRYVQTGIWSWSVWLSYITKIQEINPIWFDFFNIYSNDMGINWTDMFTCELNQQQIKSELNEMDPLNEVSHYEECVFNPDEGKSVIFTSDVIPCIDQGNTNELFCTVCQHEFKTKRAFHIHLRGVKHIQNEINHVKDQKPERFIEEIERENAIILSEISKEEKHLKWRLYNENSVNIPGSYTCTICDVTCSSVKDLHTHINGRRHLMMAEPDIIEASAAFPSANNKKIENKVISRIQIIINTCTQPLIGLNYVTEYQKLDHLIESKYICDLCKIKFERKTFIQHCVSYKHRARYLKHAYPNLYDILRHDLSSKAVKMKRLDVFTEEVENFEGRKRLNLMIEKKGTFNTTDIDKESKSEIVNVEELSSVQFPKFDNEEDKEDGEVESSDEETTLVKSKIIINNEVLIKVDQCIEELEAGEIENYYSDKEIIEEVAKEVGEVDDDVENDRLSAIDTSEFNNYELVYHNDRSEIEMSSLSKVNEPMDFLYSKEFKKVKLKEVTSDIIEHFRQEAKWALHNKSCVNTKHSTDYGLLKVKGDISGAYYTRKKKTSERSSTYDQFVNSEIELKNIIDKIQSLTPVNNVSETHMSNDLLDVQKVQNMLVNKDSEDCTINDVLRRELLEITPLNNNSSTQRRHLLPDPIDIDAINETLEILQHFTKDNIISTTISRNEHNGSQNNRIFKQSDTLAMLGDKLNKRADFLGMGQSPPHYSFPKFQPDVPPVNFQIYQNNIPIYPYLSPGMIEHHKSFSHCPPYHHEVYNPYLPPNIPYPTVISDTSNGFMSLNS